MTSDSPNIIRFPCPHCERAIKAPVAAAGKKAKCPKCGQIVSVPLPPESLTAASLSPQIMQQSDPQSNSSELTSAPIADLNSNVFETRVKAMAKLRDLRAVIAVPSLISLLKDRDSRVREEAAYSLETIGDARAVEPLIALLSDLNGNVRLKAARALGKLKDSRAIGKLVVHLRDPDNVVRFYAAQALGEIAAPEALEPLRAALTFTSHEEARRAIEKAISTLSQQSNAAQPKPSAGDSSAASPYNGFPRIGQFNATKFGLNLSLGTLDVEDVSGRVLQFVCLSDGGGVAIYAVKPDVITGDKEVKVLLKNSPLAIPFAWLGGMLTSDKGFTIFDIVLDGLKETAGDRDSITHKIHQHAQSWFLTNTSEHIGRLRTGRRIEPVIIAGGINQLALIALIIHPKRRPWWKLW